MWRFGLFAIFLLSFMENFSPTFAATVKYLHIISEIQSIFAITDVLSRVENPSDKAEEVTFLATLPQAAFISNFSIEIDGKVTFGDVKEKEKAKAEYDAATRRGHTAGLVSQRETNNFELTVNVAAKQNILFNLTYQEVLKRIHGVYKHIINVQTNGQKVQDIQVDVLIAERGKISLLKVPHFGPRVGEKTHDELKKLPDEKRVNKHVTTGETSSMAYVSFVPKTNGQLVVLYDVERSSGGGEIATVNGYFVHFFAPKNVSAGNKHILFVLDKSSSMFGEKFSQLQAAMRSILKALHEKDRFNIVMFSSDVEPWKTESLTANEANVQAAIDFVDASRAEGGTNLHDGIQKAFSLMNAEGSKPLVSMIIHLTDGQPTVGIEDPKIIVSDINKWNDEKGYSVHGIAFGVDADFRLIQKISAENKGIARKVYEDSDATEQLEGFYKQISTPMLRDIKVKYIGENVDVGSLIGENVDVYYDGSEVVTVGKLDNSDGDNGVINVDISAVTQAGEKKFTATSHGTESISGPPFCFAGPGPVPFDTLRPMPSHIIICTPSFPPPFPEPTVKPVLASATVGGFIERMWAYKTIKKMIKRSKLMDDKKESVAMKDRALQLCLKYGFVSELTSMVVVPPNQRDGTVKTLEEKTTSKDKGYDFAEFMLYSIEGDVGGGEVELKVTEDWSNSIRLCRKGIVKL